MTDPPTYPKPDDDASVSRDLGSAPGTPAWVKMFAIIAIFLALLIVFMLLTGHGPGRHM